jgi:hypothetical protein
MAIKYTKIFYCTTLPNLDFLFENIPSGNPAMNILTHIKHELNKIHNFCN